MWATNPGGARRVVTGLARAPCRSPGSARGPPGVVPWEALPHPRRKTGMMDRTMAPRALAPALFLDMLLLQIVQGGIQSVGEIDQGGAVVVPLFQEQEI